MSDGTSYVHSLLPTPVLMDEVGAGGIRADEIVAKRWLLKNICAEEQLCALTSGSESTGTNAVKLVNAA